MVTQTNYYTKAVLADLDGYISTNLVRTQNQASIAILDDDAALLKCTRRELQRAGFRVPARDELWRYSRPLAGPGDYMGFDCVVTDWDMPGGGGAKTVRDCVVAGVPVIVFTGSESGVAELVPDGVAVVVKGDFTKLITELKRIFASRA